MHKWVSLKEYIQMDRFSVGRMYVDYVPDVKSIKFNIQLTGWIKPQKYTTQQNFSWKPFITEDGEIYLAASGVTDTALVLNGKAGYKKGIELINKWAAIYGNQKFGAEGVGITEKIYNSMITQHKVLDDKYYMSEQSEDCSDAQEVLYQRYISGEEVKNIALYSSEANDYTIFGIRPIVKLPEDILVDVGSFYYNGTSKERGLQLNYHGYYINKTANLLLILKQTREFALKIEEEIGEI